MSNDLSKNIAELSGSVKNYVQTKVDLLKLSMLKKTSRFVTYLFSVLIVVLFATLLLVFFAAAFAVWYGQTYNNYVDGVLIAAGCLFIIGAAIILLRKVIITSSVIRNFSEIMFEEEENSNEGN
ncbi:MAG TPA: phage holin family protein [Draconibacterium sp.]|nr:phage holin family protein [Draconibacterium sp.]